MSTVRWPSNHRRKHASAWHVIGQNTCNPREKIRRLKRAATIVQPAPVSDIFPYISGASTLPERAALTQGTAVADGYRRTSLTL